MLKVIAVIPARGGSKRIPRKNIVDFMGEPMIAWTIKAALESKLFDKIVVSTDSVEIAGIAKEYGAEIPFLRTNYLDDFSPVSQVTIDTLGRLDKDYGLNFDVVVQLMPNCPLRTAADITNAFKFFTEYDVKFLISCFKFGWMNPWWAHKINAENNIAEPIFNENMRNSRSQDLPELFCPSGAIWIAQVDSIMKSGTFYGHNYSFFPLSWQNAMDIDDFDDLRMAHALQ
jgi:CMP-N-acetylneuraminic acid synthetase